MWKWSDLKIYRVAAAATIIVSVEMETAVCTSSRKNAANKREKDVKVLHWSLG